MVMSTGDVAFTGGEVQVQTTKLLVRRGAYSRAPDPRDVMGSNQRDMS